MKLRFRLAALILLAFGMVEGTRAQVDPVYSLMYRPPGVNYLVMRSAHFDVIYQEGTEDQAREMAAVLEASLGPVSEIFPIRDDFRMPVVLNRYGDRGNGFVAPVPFKSEIEGVPLFGRGLSVRHSDWLWAVGPHELVHAAQADAQYGFGINAMLRPFAPDIARALNMWTPPGISEGTAVYLESRLESGAGRSNHPWFTMQYRAAAGAGKPWNLAQMLENPWYTRPTDRFYKGGAALMEALEDSSGGLASVRRAAAFHNRFPLLGYGVSLWYGTGEFPARFGRRLRRAAVAAEVERQEGLGARTESRVVVGRRGVVVRNPRWLNDREVIAYMTAYDRRRGLYAIDMETGRMEARAYHELNEDLDFSISPDGSLLAGRYRQEPLAASETHSDIWRIDPETGQGHRLTEKQGLLMPVELPDGRIWAIRLEGAFNTWVEGHPETGFAPVLPPARRRFRAIEPSPDYAQVAVILNTLGVQGLYLAQSDSPADLSPLVVWEGASVYDARWSPDGQWIVFGADPTDVLNLYAVRVDDGRVVRLTNVAYGALEGAVSPDGTTLAFIEFLDQRFDLRAIPFQPENAPDARFPSAEAPSPSAFVDTVGVAVLDGAYRPLAHLKPRILHPTLYLETTTSDRPGQELGTGFGLALQGVDPLASVAYWAEGIYQADRLWGEVGATTSLSVLRPSLRVYRRPDQLLARTGSDTTRVIKDGRGAELSVQVPIILRDNIHRSAASVGLFLNHQENRLLGAGNEVVRDWRRSTALTPVARLSHGLQAGLRDLIWSRGITFVSATEFEFTVEESGGNATASYNEIGVYLPWLSRINNGLKVELASLSQTRGFVYDTDFFMPRGHEDRVPGRGTFLRAGIETVQPVWFPDTGTMLIPGFLRAVYAYGFAERLSPSKDLDVHLTSVGGGLGIQLNFLHVLEVDLRWGKAYRTGNSPDLGWVTVRR